MVNPEDRPNYAIVKNFLAKEFGIEGSSAFFDIQGKTEIFGPTKTKRNETKVAAVLRLMNQLHDAGIKFQDMAILSPYRAQVTLIRKHVAIRGETLPSIKQARIGMVDSFIGGCSPIFAPPVTTEHGATTKHTTTTKRTLGRLLRLLKMLG